MIKAATLVPAFDTAIVNTPLSLAAYTLALAANPFAVAAATAVTYSIDAGDGSAMGACKTLANTASAGTLTATALSAAGTVTYSSAGVYSAVIRIYTAAVCANSGTPTAAMAVTAVGTVQLQVRTCGA